jgi:hypothetical protein
MIAFLRKIGFFKCFFKAVDHLGIKRKLIHGSEMRRVLNSLEYGDCIAVRAYLEVSTILEDLADSFKEQVYTHIAMKGFGDFIIDATGEGYNARDVLELFPGITHIWVGRPLISDQQKVDMVNYAYDLVAQKIGFDWDFASGLKELYCSEGYYTCLEHVAPGLLTMRNRAGVLTITPDDIRDASSVFRTVIEIIR